MQVAVMQGECSGCMQVCDRLRERIQTAPYGKIGVKCRACGTFWVIARGGDPEPMDSHEGDPRAAFGKRKEQRPL